MEINKWLHLYIGCNTNKGILVGIKKDVLFIQEPGDAEIAEYKISDIGHNLFLLLRKLHDLTEEQSKQLIKEGISIGRPYGYTFSGNGILYLLSLSVDLFGLIKAGFAKDLSEK